MIIDSHMHLINMRTQPMDLLFKRFNIPRAVVEGAVNFASDHKGMLDVLEECYEKVTDKQLNVNDFIDIFKMSIDDYLKHTLSLMDESGVDEGVLMLLDLETPVGKVDPSFTYEDQIETVAKASDRFLKMVGYDPRRKNGKELVTRAIEELSYTGVKIYPALGNPINTYGWLFDYCESNGIPITTHCSPGGIGNHKEFSDPDEYFDLLMKHPRTKLCFAHSTGNSQFINYFIHSDNNQFSTLYMYCQELENVVMDLSFHQDAVENPKKYFRALNMAMDDPFLIDKLLVGTDYPLHLTEYPYKQFLDEFKKNSNYKTLAGYNAESFWH